MNLNELEKLSDAATPGPWLWPNVGSSDFVIAGEDRLGICHADSPRTAAFIAAMNPQTVKAMCQLIREQHEALIRHQELTRPIDTTTEALAKFEEFNK